MALSSHISCRKIAFVLFFFKNFLLGNRTQRVLLYLCTIACTSVYLNIFTYVLSWIVRFRFSPIVANDQLFISFNREKVVFLGCIKLRIKIFLFNAIKIGLDSVMVYSGSISFKIMFIHLNFRPARLNKSRLRIES